MHNAEEKNGNGSKIRPSDTTSIYHRRVCCFTIDLDSFYERQDSHKSYAAKPVRSVSYRLLGGSMVVLVDYTV